MRENMMGFEIWKQHREQMLREVETNRLAKALRAARKQRDDTNRVSALAWEIKRHAGRLAKLLNTLRKAD